MHHEPGIIKSYLRNANEILGSCNTKDFPENLNFIIFTADDLGPGGPDRVGSGVFGGKMPDLAPNIDYYASQGVMFMNAYVNTVPYACQAGALFLLACIGTTAVITGSFLQLFRSFSGCFEKIRSQAGLAVLVTGSHVSACLSLTACRPSKHGRLE